MAGKTGISWVNDGLQHGGTLNPQVGCSMADETCQNCYAMVLAERLEKMGMPQYEGTINNGIWSAVINEAHGQLEKVLRKTSPQPYFIGSMTDMFHINSDPITMLLTYGTILLTPLNFYYLLTKRPRRMLTFFEQTSPAQAIEAIALSDINFSKKQERIDFFLKFWHQSGCSIPPNMLLGASIGLQAVVKQRLTPLRKLSSLGYPVWVSAEPLLEQIDLGDIQFLSQIVTGGQSCKVKLDARLFDLNWGRNLQRQAATWGIPFYFKQTGSNPCEDGKPIQVKGKGDQLSDFPEDLRVQELPEAVLSQWRIYCNNFSSFTLE